MKEINCPCLCHDKAILDVCCEKCIAFETTGYLQEVSEPVRSPIKWNKKQVFDGSGKNSSVPEEPQTSLKLCGCCNTIKNISEDSIFCGRCTASTPSWEESFDIKVKGLEVYRGENKEAYLEMSDMPEIKSFIREVESSAIERTLASVREIFEKNYYSFCSEHKNTHLDCIRCTKGSFKPIDFLSALSTLEN